MASDQNLRLTLLRKIPEDANLRLQWNELVAGLDQPQVFYTWEWARAVQRAFYASLRPLLLLAHDESNILRGVAALATDARGEQCSFLCASTGDYCDFLSAPRHKPTFVEGVLAQLRKEGIREINLTNLPADSDSVVAIRQASRTSGYHSFEHTAYFCAQVLLSKTDRQSLPRRSVLRRAVNALGRESALRLDHARTWDTVEPLLNQFIQAHVARFLATGRMSNLVSAERRVFLEELAKLLCAEDWLDLTRLMSGKQVFAWNYGFRFAGVWFWYQPTFDSAYEKHSPGFCLLSKLVEEALEIPDLRVVDLGLGAEGYKDQFSNQTRKTLLVALNVSASAHYRKVFGYYGTAMIKASSRSEAAARAIRDRWRHFRQAMREQSIVLWLLRRFRHLLWSDDEVVFYEWTGAAEAETARLKIQNVDLNDLASAALQYPNDEATQIYLRRAAARLRDNAADAFGLVDQQGCWLHFAWSIAFDGFFLSELNAKVDSPSPDCSMLFDCWTPSAVRGHGYYGQAIALIAERMQRMGKRPWIFSASSNVPSIRGLAKAGFKPRHSLVRKRFLFWQKITQLPAEAEIPAEVSAHA